MKNVIIGVDLAKAVFQLHGATADGNFLFRKKLSRGQFLQFMSQHPDAVVAMEACGSAHYWAGELVRLGHDVLLIPPQYVRPFVKRQKNDATDAEAIVIAARQPEMRFVSPKSEEQQSRAALFRARERLVHQRTELVNALRALLYEFGHVLPAGIKQISRVAAILDTNESTLPLLMRDECQDLLQQIEEKTVRINARTKKAHQLAEDAVTAKRLQTLPGVGPMTGLAFEAFAPDMITFRRGRDFAAWLGLVPRQHSSGGGAIGADYKSGTGRHPAPAHYRRHVPAQPDGAIAHPPRLVAGANAGQETAHVGRHRSGEQDGARHLGHDDETGGLSSSDVGCCCMMTCSQLRTAPVKEV